MSNLHVSARSTKREGAVLPQVKHEDASQKPPLLWKQEGCSDFFPPLLFHMGKNKVKKQHFQRRKTWKEFLFSGSLLQLLICGKPQWKVSNMAASLYTRIQ